MAAVHSTTMPCEPNTAYKCTKKANLFSIFVPISNLRLTSASTDFRDMSRSPGSVKTTLILENFLLFRVFSLSRYLSYL